MTDVQNVHHGLAFFDPVDNPMGVRLSAKEQVAKFLICGSDWPALGRSLQAINRFGKFVEPSPGRFRSLASTKP